MSEMNMVEALNSALSLEMERERDIIVLGEDVGRDGGVFRVTQGLFKAYGRARVLDTPLAESGIIGMSIGMAAYGMRPVAEIQFMGFLWPAVDQLASHASRMRGRTMGRYSSPLVVRFPYGGGVRALEHHAESFESVLASIPGLKVVVPSTPYDAKGLLISSIRDNDPVAFMEPKRIYRTQRQKVPDEAYELELGKASIVRKGEDLSIVGWGSMMPKILRTAELMDKKGISAEVVDLRSLAPYDKKTVHASVSKTGRCVVVQEAPRTCGFASEVIACINDEILTELKAPVERVTGYDIPFPYFKMEQWMMPDADRILKACRRVLQW